MSEDALPQDLLGATAEFERYSDDVRQVMRIANREAKRHWHEQIGTLHALTALATERTGVGGYLLRCHSATSGRIRKRVQLSVPRGKSFRIWGKLPPAETVNAAISVATIHAIKAKHDSVGTAGLLLALFSVDPRIEEVLRELGVDVPKFRVQLARALHSHMVEKPGEVLDLQAILGSS